MFYGAPALDVGNQDMFITLRALFRAIDPELHWESYGTTDTDHKVWVQWKGHTKAVGFVHELATLSKEQLETILYIYFGIEDDEQRKKKGNISMPNYVYPQTPIKAQIKEKLDALREHEQTAETVLLVDLFDLLLQMIELGIPLVPSLLPPPCPPYRPSYPDEYQPWNPLSPPYKITLSTTTCTENGLLGNEATSPLPSSTANEEKTTTAGKKRGGKQGE